MFVAKNVFSALNFPSALQVQKIWRKIEIISPKIVCVREFAIDFRSIFISSRLCNRKGIQHMHFDHIRMCNKN